MKQTVMKFGGTSIGNAKNILNVANIIKNNLDNNPIIVVSAISGMTDKLINGAKTIIQDKNKIKSLIDEIKEKHYGIMNELRLDTSIINDNLKNLEKEFNNLTEISDKSMNTLISFGERISSKIVSATINSLGIKSSANNSYNIGFLTNDNFTDAKPLKKAYVNIKENLNKLDNVPVITGFIGKNKTGEITTLGRGGSDYTATIIGNAIDAKEIQIWTDVNGVMTTDPKLVKNAITINKMTFNEASELAFFGAKILHPKTMIPAIDKNIPIIVKNTMKPNHPGTTIIKDIEKCEKIVTAISLKKNIKIIRIESKRMLDSYGFLAKIFTIFDNHKISVDTLATSEVSVSMTIDSKCNCENILEELKQIGKIDIYENMNLVCVVGRCLRFGGKIHGKIFTCLENENINIKMISQGPSLINISFVVNDKHGEKSIRLLHKKLIENEN